MTTVSKALAKTAVASVAAGALAMTSAAPAFARDRDYDRDRDRGGVDAGDIIAGAVIIGGIAAIASAASNRDRYDDRRYRGRYDDRRGYRYDDRRGNGRYAVEQCIRAAERDARRSGYRYADVTQIRDVDRKRGGWRVKGNIEVDGSGGYGRYSRNSRYDRYDRRGYRSGDSGRFTCDIQRGRIVGLGYRGIRGLR